MQPRDDRHQAPRVSLGTRQLVTFLRAKSAKNGYCWWRQGTIADVMERGLRTVNRQIAEAIAAGLLRSERHGHGNYYTPCGLVEKVAYRDAALEKPRSSATDGVSDTPNWRIAAGPVSMTEILKPEKKNQSECTVREHREPSVTETEPSLFEKAQTAAITEVVRACGFEPAPDLVAKLERKRRHYGVTGFVVAAAIARAFKLVEGTSNRPQRPAWFTTVVENALAGSKRPTGTEQRDVAATMAPTGAAKPERGQEAQHEQSAIPPSQDTASQWTPGQGMSTQGSEPARAEAAAPPARDQVAGSQRAAAELSVEDRRLLAQARRIFPFASRENLMEAVAEMRAAQLRTVEESAAAVQPRPPQSEFGPRHEVATAALGGLR